MEVVLELYRNSFQANSDISDSDVKALAVFGVADASFSSEVVGGCGYMGGAAMDPGSHARKIAKDASDFAKFPDKSKLPQKIFTWEEVKQYDGEQGRAMYLVVDNNVYDFTVFADLHPAGPDPLKQHAGNDASAAMRASGMPKAVMDVYIQRFKVGAVDKPHIAKFEMTTVI